MRPIMRHIRKADLVMHVGSGDVYTDLYPKSPARAAWLRRRAWHRRTFFQLSAVLASLRDLPPAARCGICGRVLDAPDEPLSAATDCGGDCWSCVSRIEKMAGADQDPCDFDAAAHSIQTSMPSGGSEG
jgi:hypothetical protein